jgi:hypothetical protein
MTTWSESGQKALAGVASPPREAAGLAAVLPGSSAKEKVMPIISMILMLLPLLLQLITWLESKTFNPNPLQRKALAALLNRTQRFGDACHNRGIAPLVNGELTEALDDLHHAG